MDTRFEMQEERRDFACTLAWRRFVDECIRLLDEMTSLVMCSSQSAGCDDDTSFRVYQRRHGLDAVASDGETLA